MTLCLFCFPLHNLPFFPLSLPPTCWPIWLGGGGEVCWGWAGVSWAFCLPFVSQRTWENHPSDSGVGHCSGSPVSTPPSFLPPSQQPSFFAPPTPPPSSGGGLELGRGLNGALKGSLSKGGRLNSILSTQLWSLGGGLLREGGKRGGQDGGWGAGCEKDPGLGFM